MYFTACVSNQWDCLLQENVMLTNYSRILSKTAMFHFNLIINYYIIYLMVKKLKTKLLLSIIGTGFLMVDEQIRNVLYFFTQHTSPSKFVHVCIYLFILKQLFFIK